MCDIRKIAQPYKGIDSHGQPQPRPLPRTSLLDAQLCRTNRLDACRYWRSGHTFMNILNLVKSEIGLSRTTQTSRLSDKGLVSRGSWSRPVFSLVSWNFMHEFPRGLQTPVKTRGLQVENSWPRQISLLCTFSCCFASALDD